MAVNLIDSSDITVTQTGNNIQLETTVDMQQVETDTSQNTQDIQDIQNGNVYSTSEVDTGKVWIDNKTIYRKVINFGALPSSATSKNVAHGITNIDNVVNIYGFAKNSSASQKYIPLPFASKDASSNIYLAADDTNVTLNVGYDRSSYSAYVIVEYTKTN